MENLEIKQDLAEAAKLVQQTIKIANENTKAINKLAEETSKAVNENRKMIRELGQMIQQVNAKVA